MPGRNTQIREHGLHPVMPERSDDPPQVPEVSFHHDQSGVHKAQRREHPRVTLDADEFPGGIHDPQPTQNFARVAALPERRIHHDPLARCCRLRRLDQTESLHTQL